MTITEILRTAIAEGLSPEEFKTLLRMEFGSFAEKAFYELNANSLFMPNWHHELIASKLEACRTGKLRRLIINVPPRHLKSHYASVALPAFILGHEPSARVICVSYAQGLAEKLAGDCRAVVSSSWYQDLFPRMRLARITAEEFTTTAKGFRMATSVGGVLTGRGSDMIILDDPLKPDEANSDTQRAKVNTWFHETLYSRLDAKATGAIVIVMQRLHMDDLVGHVMELDDWEVVSLPSIAEEEEHHIIEGPGGTWEHVRQPGDILHPERENRAVLDQLKRTMGEYAFSAQCQQNPVPKGGALIKASWWGSYDEAPAKFERVIQSWDTACKDKDQSDFSVCTTWGLKENQMFLLDVLRRRMNYPDLKRAVRAEAMKYKPDIILIENKASGISLIQELRRDGMNGILEVEPEGDKFTRMSTCLTWIEEGNVRLPKLAPWLAEYRAELESFPVGKKDDQVDSTSQALAWAQKHQFRGEWKIYLGGPRRISSMLDSYVNGSSSYFDGYDDHYRY